MLSYSAPDYACREEREQVPQQICDSFAQKVCTTEVLVMHCKLSLQIAYKSRVALIS